MNVITAYATLSKLIKTLTGVVTDFSYDSANKAIKLTTTTGTYSIPTSQIIVSSVKGDPGQDGKSAYEIAVDHGYSGSEEDWINNLGSSFDDSALQAAINKNKTDISNLSADLTNSQSTISQNTSNISKNKTDITNIKSDLSDAVADVATNKSDISDLKTNVNKIGDLATLQTTDKTSVINAINELNSKFMQSMTYANKKLTITYKNGLTFDIDLSSIITDTNIGELSNVNDTGITDKQTLIFDAASNKYIPGTIDTSQTLKDAKDYTDNQIATISNADAIQCDEKPSLSGDTVTYKKGGATQTTTNLNTWFYYQDAEGNWQQTIFIDSVEVTIAMTGVDLTDYVSKTKDVVSTYTGTEVDKNKVVDIAALDALKTLINTDLSKKANTTDIVDALTSNATDKPLSANQGSVIKTELDKKANTTDMNTELAKKINTTDIIDNLTSTDINKPLSANQGKVLKAEVDKKINKTDIVNNLTSTNTDKPLSANQGKVLKNEVDLKANDSEVVKKTDITTTIDSTSTDKQVPSAKSVYSSLLANEKLIQYNYDFASSDSLNINLPRAGFYKIDNPTKGVPEGNPQDYVLVNIPRRGDTTLMNFGWQLLFSPRTTYFWARRIWNYTLDYVYTEGDYTIFKQWQRVCTTSVADVPVTNIAPADTTTFISFAGNAQCNYYVRNGICSVTLWGVKVTSTGNTIRTNVFLPKAANLRAGTLMTGTGDATAHAFAFVIDTGELCFDVKDTNIYLYGSFSYLVAES